MKAKTRVYQEGGAPGGRCADDPAPVHQVPSRQDTAVDRGPRRANLGQLSVANLLHNLGAYCQVHPRGGRFMKVRTFTFGVVVAAFTVASAAPALAQSPKEGGSAGSGARSNPGSSGGGGESAVA